MHWLSIPSWFSPILILKSRHHQKKSPSTTPTLALTPPPPQHGCGLGCAVVVKHAAAVADWIIVDTACNGPALVNCVLHLTHHFAVSSVCSHCQLIPVLCGPILGPGRSRSTRHARHPVHALAVLQRSCCIWLMIRVRNDLVRLDGVAVRSPICSSC